MRIRIRFTKMGPIRFVGHLDFMRSFQKMLKKSGLPAVYSSGFNPHMMLSFAAPLGVGEETCGDYADIDFAFHDRFEMTAQEEYRLTDIGLDNAALPDPPSQEEFLKAVNQAAPPGVRALSAVRVGLTRNSKAMALVRYASFKLVLKDSFLPDIGTQELNRQIEALLAGEEIILHKKTKKNEKDVNIRPLILSCRAEDAMTPDPDEDKEISGSRTIFLVCAQGSSQNLKPGSFLEAMASSCGVPYDPFGFRVIRLDLYDEQMKTLEELGAAF